MSITGKSTKSYKKSDLVNGKAPSTAFRNLRFAHQASLNDVSFALTSLIVPPSMSALGFSNPSQSDLTSANLFINKNNLQLVSSARGPLVESYDYTVLGNGTIAFSDNFGTALSGEIFIGTLNNVATTGNLIADTTFILETGTLAANSTSIAIGQSFKTNLNSSKQIGGVVVFIDGQQMLRNVGNAAYAPSADGDYQEIDNGSGDCTLIQMNIPDVNNARTYTVMSSWLSVVKPDGSVVEAINKQQATIDKVVETLAIVAGVPQTDFQAAPTQPQLNQFGTRLLATENNLALIGTTYTNNSLITLSTGSGNWFNALTQAMPAGTWLVFASAANTTGGITQLALVVSDVGSVANAIPTDALEGGLNFAGNNSDGLLERKLGGIYFTKSSAWTLYICPKPTYTSANIRVQFRAIRIASTP